MASTLRLPGDPAELNDWDSAPQPDSLALWVNVVADAPAANPPVRPSVTIHEDSLVVTREAFIWPKSEEQASAYAITAYATRTETVMIQASFAAPGTAITDNSSVHALRVDVAKATYTVPVTNHVLDGTGLKGTSNNPA